jgi:hypothetical protein
MGAQSGGFSMPQDPDALTALAKMAELCERWDEMLVAVRRLARVQPDLASDEREMVAVAYKQTVGSRRLAWRVAAAVEHTLELKDRAIGIQLQQQQQQRQPEQQAVAASSSGPLLYVSSQQRLARDLRLRIEQEIADICADAIALVESVLLPASPNDLAAAAYWKMLGDYRRYSAEISAAPSASARAAAAVLIRNAASAGATFGPTGSVGGGGFGGGVSGLEAPIAAHNGERRPMPAGAAIASSIADEEPWRRALDAYNRAADIAAPLRPSHPLRLSIALNTSVFFYETLHDAARAVQLATEAFEASAADATPPETVAEAERREALGIMQVLHDNLFIWTRPPANEGEGDEDSDAGGSDNAGLDDETSDSYGQSDEEEVTQWS